MIKRKRYSMSTYYPSTSSSKKLSSLSCLSTIFCSAGGSFSRAGSLFGSNGAEELCFLGPSYLCSTDVVEGGPADGSLGCGCASALASLSGFLFHHMVAGVVFVVVVEKSNLASEWRDVVRVRRAR